MLSNLGEQVTIKIVITKNKRSFFSGIPSWALALYAMLIITIGLILLFKSWIEVNHLDVLIAYNMWGLLNAVCCLFIVMKNPKSVWSVTLIINSVLIIIALRKIIGRKYTDFNDWHFICVVLVLSIIASIIGAWIGRRTATVLSQV